MQDSAEQCEPLLKKREVCQRATISLRTLNYHLARGDLPYIKLGGAVRFRANDINDWIDSCRLGGGRKISSASHRARARANKHNQQDASAG
jgi:excisionase family DNA binding protein